MTGERDPQVGPLIRHLRTSAGLSQEELARRLGTTQSGVSRLENGGGAGIRLDTLARVAVAVGRHLVLSFPDEVPAPEDDTIRLA